MAAIKRPRETRNGRFWMLIELKKSCIGESDAGNQTQFTATKPRNAREVSYRTTGEVAARLVRVVHRASSRCLSEVAPP